MQTEPGDPKDPGDGSALSPSEGISSKHQESDDSPGSGIMNPSDGASSSDGTPGQQADNVQGAVGQMIGRGSVYLTVWALQLVATALFTPVLTRLLGPSQFGRVALALTIMQVLVCLFSLGFQSGIQRIYADHHGVLRARGLLSAAVLLAVFLTEVAAITEPWWGPIVGFRDLHSIALLTVYWSGAAAITQVALALLRSQDRFRPFAAAGLMQSVGGQIVGVCLLLTVSKSTTIYISGLLIGQVLAMLIALIGARPVPRGLRDWGTLGAALRFSIPLVPNLLAAFVLNAGDRIVVQHKLGSFAVGRYQVAYVIGSLAILLLGAANTMWAPRFLAISDDKLRWAVLAHLRDEVFTLLLPLICAISLGAPIALRIFAPPRYGPDSLVSITILVAVSAIPFAVYIANVRIFIWYKRTGILGWTSAVAAALNVILNILLVPNLHILGSALATFICYGALALSTSLAARRYVRLTRPRRETFICAFGAIAFAYTTLLIPTSVGFLVLRCVLATVCGVWFIATGWKIARRA